MKAPTALLLAVCLGAAPAAAQAPAPDTTQRDVRCLGITAVAMALIEEKPEAERAKKLAVLGGGLMYFLGRLEVRDPAEDWVMRAGTAVYRMSEAEVEDVGKACAALLDAKGRELMEKGQALQDLGPPREN